MIHQKNLIAFVSALANKKIATSEQFLDFEKKLISQFKIQPPSNTDILEIYRQHKKQIKRNPYFDKKLNKRPVRSLSGVAVVSVLTKPYSCPGHCLYCPSEKGIPKSYLSGEPAVERAKSLKYNPYWQVKKRIEVLAKNGHPTDKIELIVIGGTWSYLPKKYQNWFIKRCFDGANTADKRGYNNTRINADISVNQRKSALERAQKLNETTKHRIVGITLETRPDYITPQEIKQMRHLGCTRVELGVQTIEEKILKLNQRGHGIKQIIDATRLLKNAGFKICYHLMPGLMGSSPKKDLEVFQKIFSQPQYRPDMIKVYPCVVTRGSKLYRLWRQGKYKPYSDKKLIDLLVKIKSIIPPHVRVIRMIRDIPSQKIEGGSRVSNLREVVHQEMKKRELKCRCIRCREIKSITSPVKNLKLITRHFPASGGQEFFLSFEDTRQDKLVAFLRLRLPQDNLDQTMSDLYKLLPVLQDAAIIREIHTYGALVPIGQKGKTSQHLGLGKKLIKEAEKIARRWFKDHPNYSNLSRKGTWSQRDFTSEHSEQFGWARSDCRSQRRRRAIRMPKIAVISGIGVRNYYRPLGYQLKDTYMIKNLP